ncbi:MAG: hypothetical protein SGI97_08905 [candidate division Zixibacteria bacterium]|nr:hypothetical protein [candidate division Zixibacteria bacterium]
MEEQNPNESFFHNPTVEPGVDASTTTTADDVVINVSVSEKAEAKFLNEETRVAAIMAYVPFLCFIPLMNMRQNKQVYFHARQGVVLFFIEMLAILFSIDRIADFVFRGLLVAALGLAAAGIYFALQGKNHRLPVIGDLADKANL